MDIKEYIVSAFRCLSASKMRTFLTTLGIIVGISSVILINTIGGTIATTISSTIGNMFKGNIMDVYIVDKEMEDINTSGLLTFLTDEEFEPAAVAEFEKMMGDKLKTFSAEYIGGGKLTSSDNKSSKISMNAYDADLLKLNITTLKEGRYISDDDYENQKPVIIISDKSAEKMFGNKSAVGEQVYLSDTDSPLNGREFTVVGVYENKDMSGMYAMMGDEEQSTTAYISDTYFYSNSLDKTEDYWLLEYSFEDIDKEELRQITEDYFNPYFEGTDYKVKVVMLTDQLDQINSMVGIVTKIIAAVAAISLLVGGIGVMNIMLVSVSERTMEIGVRKAMGADNKSIRIQFIVESIVLALIGSVLGIVLGLVEAKLLAMIIISVTSNMESNVIVDLSIPVPAIIGSVIFSFVVGLVFGVYPADKAAKMEVVDALRYE